VALDKIHTNYMIVQEILPTENSYSDHIVNFF